MAKKIKGRVGSVFYGLWQWVLLASKHACSVQNENNQACMLCERIVLDPVTYWVTENLVIPLLSFSHARNGFGIRTVLRITDPTWSWDGATGRALKSDSIFRATSSDQKTCTASHQQVLSSSFHRFPRPKDYIPKLDLPVRYVDEAHIQSEFSMQNSMRNRPFLASIPIRSLVANLATVLSSESRNLAT